MGRNTTKWTRWGGMALFMGALAWALTPAAFAQGFGGGAGGGFGGGAGGGLGGGGLGGGGLGGGGLGGGGLGGGSFSGGGSMSGGSSFSGGTAFSGGSAGMGGAGMTGGGYGAAGGMSAFGSTGISPTNVLGSFYVNPLALGLNVQTGVAANPSSAFGQPTFGNSASSPSGYGMGGGIAGGMAGGLGGMMGRSGGMLGGMSGLGGLSTGGTGMGNRGTTGTAAATPFMVVLQSPPNPPQQAFAPRNVALEQRALNVLAGSSSLPSKQNILVGVVGNTVILRGAVSDPHQKQLAEALLRLTPGVVDVRNELQVR